MEQVPENPSVSIQANSPSKINFKHLAKIYRESLHTQTYVPFLFKRKPHNSSASLTPAPGMLDFRIGQYEVQSIFGKQSQRDQLAEKYNIELVNSRKIKQSAIFKSASKRFRERDREVKDHSSLSDYCYSMGQTVRRSFHKSKIVEKFKPIFRQRPSNYPSIPDDSTKFGYELENSQPKDKIHKDLKQIERQKQNTKQYLSRLNQERNYNSLSYSSWKIKQNQHQFESKQQEKRRLALLGLSSHERQKIEERERQKQRQRLVLHQTTQCNWKTVKQNLSEKQMLSSQIGPGSYKTSQTDFDQATKARRYQFFNSTEPRFRTCPQQKPPAQKSKRVSVSLKNKKKTGPLKQTAYFKRQINYERPVIAPGPGDYNPQQDVIKRNMQKMGEFPRSARFQDIKEAKEEDKENMAEKVSTNKTSPKINFRLMKKKDLRQKFQSAAPQSPQEVYKDLAPLGKNEKRVQRGTKLKKFSTKKTDKNEDFGLRNNNDLSSYSLCSWEQRPQSRVEAILTNKSNKKVQISLI